MILFAVDRCRPMLDLPVQARHVVDVAAIQNGRLTKETSHNTQVAASPCSVDWVG